MLWQYASPTTSGRLSEDCTNFVFLYIIYRTNSEYDSRLVKAQGIGNITTSISGGNWDDTTKSFRYNGMSSITFSNTRDFTVVNTYNDGNWVFRPCFIYGYMRIS